MTRIKSNLFHINPEINIQIIDIVNGLLVTGTTDGLRRRKHQIWKEVKP